MNTIATGLELRNGIWYAKVDTSSDSLSYPDDGNQACSAVEDTSFWFRHRNNCLLAVLKQFPPAGTLFDIGGGNGFQALAFAKAGYPTVLVEPGKSAVITAQQRGVEQIVCATLGDAKFLPNTLPAIGLFDVLEHIESREAFLEQLHTILQPGGRLYVTVPAYQWLWSDEDKRAGHFLRYTRRGLRKTLQAAGFQLEFSSYFFSTLPLPIWLARSLPSLLKPQNTATLERQTAYQHRINMDHFLSFETLLIKHRLPVWMGSSCLAVVKKV